VRSLSNHNVSQQGSLGNLAIFQNPSFRQGGPLQGVDTFGGLSRTPLRKHTVSCSYACGLLVTPFGQACCPTFTHMGSATSLQHTSY
jgi:hypothetical protein